MARFGEDVARLLEDPGIVRNRLKVEAAIGNARAGVRRRELELALRASVVIRGRQDDRQPMDALCGDPRRDGRFPRDEPRPPDRGFRFVGPTISYSLMQAAGLVNDHETSCFRYRELASATAARMASFGGLSAESRL